MPSIAHIINVTEITEAKHASYLHVAQPLTMKTMAIARKHAAEQSVAVELVAIKHHKESVDIPPEFVLAPDIESYAWEHIEHLKQLETKKPLPRLVDIVNGLYQTSTADYFIYTNLDIGLFPGFYIQVSNLIEQGYDAFCINRRTLPKEHNEVLLDENAVDTIFSLKGSEHPGIDCFVFRRDIVPKLKLENVFLGFPPIGQVLKCQIEDNSNNFRWIKDLVLTFHIGRDRPWAGKSAYFEANLAQAEGLYTKCFPGPPGLFSRIWSKLIG